MGNVTPFPLDFDRLEKGMTIDIPIIAHFSGRKPGTKEYDFAKLALRERIMKHFNQSVTVRCEGDTLHICTDEEAALHNPKMFDQRTKQLARLHTRTLAIDSTNLNEVTAKRLERRIDFQSRIVGAMANAGSRIMKIAYKRTVPVHPALVDKTSAKS